MKYTVRLLQTTSTMCDCVKALVRMRRHVGSDLILIFSAHVG